jgi:hypothetical protein
MTSEHGDHGTVTPGRGGDGLDDVSEVPRRQDVRQCAEECVEGAVLARWMGELARRDLVRALRDRDGADAREVGFRGPA